MGRGWADLFFGRFNQTPCCRPPAHKQLPSIVQTIFSTRSCSSPSSSQASRGVGLIGEPTALSPDPADELQSAHPTVFAQDEAHTHILRSLDPGLKLGLFSSVFFFIPYRRSLPGVPAFSRSFGRLQDMVSTYATCHVVLSRPQRTIDRPTDW